MFLILTTLISGLSFAQEEKKSLTQEINFEEVMIDGEVTKPGLKQIDGGLHKHDFGAMIKLRKSFNVEIKRSISQVN